MSDFRNQEARSPATPLQTPMVVIPNVSLNGPWNKQYSIAYQHNISKVHP